MKSIERSSAWLSNLLQPNSERDSLLNIIIQMAGRTSKGEVEAIHLEKLDDGVVVPLRQSIDAQHQKANDSTPGSISYLEFSLTVLPITKLRLLDYRIKFLN